MVTNPTTLLKGHGSGRALNEPVGLGLLLYNHLGLLYNHRLWLIGIGNSRTKYTADDQGHKDVFGTHSLYSLNDYSAWLMMMTVVICLSSANYGQSNC